MGRVSFQIQYNNMHIILHDDLDNSCIPYNVDSLYSIGKIEIP
jgi:hypothetical protein